MKLDWNKLPRQLRTVAGKQVGGSAGIGIVLAIIYALVAPSWFQSTLTVVPAAPSKGPGLGAQLAGVLGADLPVDFGNNADVERIAAILQSTSVTDAVIEKFDLKKRYRVEFVEHARKELWSHCSTQIDRKARVVGLVCEDRDPQFAQELLRFFGDFGNNVFRRVSTSSASEEVHFLEQRVAETRKEADESALRLREFEERYKVVDLESQSKAVVSAMASLRSQEISKELQLSYLNSFSSRDEATAVQIRQQLAVMTAKFRNLEESEGTPGRVGDPAETASTSKGIGAKAADIFPPAMSVPKLRFELEQLYREKKIREANLLLLMQRLELAKVNEARDTSAFLILDHPALPTYKSRPKRLIILANGLILGLLLGLAWVFGPPYFRLIAGTSGRHISHAKEGSAA